MDNNVTVVRPIYVFVRHCGVSSNSINKERPSWFSKEKVFANLMATKDDNTHVYVMLDTASTKEDASQHFTARYNDVKVMPMYGGSDAHSFINMIEYVSGLSSTIANNAIIYLLEDDYLHRRGWGDALREVFDNGIADYATLYDHSDKYTHPMYKGLQSELFVTKSCHWRTTPSTTNTYAMLFSTLINSKHDHLRFSCKVARFTFDHAKFTYFNNTGKKLVSSIPAFSTHVESEFLSPIIDWANIFS